MSIKGFNKLAIGTVGKTPQIWQFETDNTLAEVVTAGYLDKLLQQGIDIRDGDMAVVSTKTTPTATTSTAQWLKISITGTVVQMGLIEANASVTNNAIQNSVNTLADLVAVDTSSFTANVVIYVRDTKANYYIDIASTETADGVEIIQPAVGSGRWFRIVSRLDDFKITGTGGVADTYVASHDEKLVAYEDGARVYFKADVVNTGASTLNVDGVGAKKILHPDGSDVVAGEIPLDTYVHLIYNTSADGGAGAFEIVTQPLLRSRSYITQTATDVLSGEFAMASLPTGIVKNTTGTGVPTIAVAGAGGDYEAPGDNVYYVGANRAYTTIQAALTAIGDATVAADNVTPQTVFVDGGVYDEDLTIPQGRIINLVAMGSVLLGDGAGGNWSSTNSRNITFNVDGAFIFAANAPRPALTMTVLGETDTTSTFVAQAAEWNVSGSLLITTGATSHTVVLRSCKFAGITKAATGLTNLLTYRCLFSGALSMATATIYERAEYCQFDGLVTTDSFNSLFMCEVRAGMTVAVVGDYMPPSGMYHTEFTGTFTGPAGSLKLDAITDKFFIDNGASLAGGATKVYLESLPATQVVYDNSTSGLASTTTQGAIDELSPYGVTNGFFDGSMIDQPSMTVSSDGVTITYTIEKSGTGDIRFKFSDGVYTLDCTPAATISLTAGTDASPTLNYVYLLQSTKALTVSTSGWPATEYAPLATVLCQSAASLQTQGAYSFQGWTDHIEDASGQGHLTDLNLWIRNQYATWQSGVALTPTVGAATFDIATTSGAVLQLHEHTFPVFDTSTGSTVYMANYPANNYKPASDLTLTYVDVDANNNALGTASSDFYNLVIWGVVSENSGDCQLMLNLPNGFYASDAGSQAQLDNDQTAVYTIPTEFKGTGFLIARLTVQYNAGTYVILKQTDLRGQIPSSAAGSAGAASTSFSDASFNIYNDADNTKKLITDVSNVTTSTTRTATVPDQDGLLMLQNTNGIAVRTSATTSAARSVTNVANETVVTNGDGVSGDIQIGLASSIDLGGKTLEIPNGTAPTTNVAGQIALDTNGDGSTITQGVLQVYDGTQNIYIPGADAYPTATQQVQYYDSATNKIKWGTVSAIGGLTGTGLSGLEVVQKSATETVTSSTTLQNDNELFFSMSANESVTMFMFISCFGAAAADIKFDLSIPTGAGAGLSVFGPDLSTTGITNTNMTLQNIGAGAGTGAAVGFDGSNAQNIIIIANVNTSTTAGTVYLQWAQNTSNATASEVRGGSYMTIYRYA